MPATALATERITISDHIIDEARDMPVTSDSTLVLRTAEGEEMELPADLQQILLHTLSSIAGDGQVTIGRMPEELTSTVAADLLGVSRPTLMKWARAGEIASFTVGSHTRFQRDEVLRVRALRARKRTAAHEALREFDAEHEEMLED
jgi:excisionase family DNA binding protein